MRSHGGKASLPKFGASPHPTKPPRKSYGCTPRSAWNQERRRKRGLFFWFRCKGRSIGTRLFAVAGGLFGASLFGVEGGVSGREVRSVRERDQGQVIPSSTRPLQSLSFLSQVSVAGMTWPRQIGLPSLHEVSPARHSPRPSVPEAPS